MLSGKYLPVTGLHRRPGDDLQGKTLTEKGLSKSPYSGDNQKVAAYQCETNVERSQLMSETLMILPASDAKAIRLVRVPDDYESHEAYRHVTGLIAAAEEQNPDCDTDEIVAVLEDQGFETMEFILGPTLP
jgi:hypothetical protein